MEYTLVILYYYEINRKVLFDCSVVVLYNDGFGEDIS